MDAWISRPAAESQQPAFAIAPHADGPMFQLSREPVYRGENLLYFIANDVPALLVGHAVDEFAVRLVGHADFRIARPCVLAVDQCRHQDATTILRKPARILVFLCNTGRQAN